jgi:hypothetical protein
MQRKIEQWRSSDPEMMAHKQSRAAIYFALKDAKADILELYRQREELLAALKASHQARAFNMPEITALLAKYEAAK